MSYIKNDLIFILLVISILLIFIFSYQSYINDYRLKSSFAIEDTKTISNNDVVEFIKQGDYNQEIIKDIHKAIEWYDKGLAIDSENVETLAKKAKALSRLYNFSEAQKLIDKAFKISPIADSVFNSKGFLLYDKGNYSAAIKVL